MNVRTLTHADAAAFQSLRLAGLLERPTAFTSSFDEERYFAWAAVEERIAQRPGAALDRTLCALQRKKLAS
jgi:hypothetical protein